MCLLVSQPANSKFDDDFIKGVYNLNSDGIGVMYAENGTINILKFVPKTEKDFVNFFRTNIEGRDCAWHARMRTHGDIDLENCHPYQVLSQEDGYPLYLAHNGVLSTGNAKDTTKSDTWHYIRDYLRPMLLKNPEFFMTEAFKSIVGSHIGSGNKFILMDAYGNQVTINRHVGVFHEGAWLSNTYAWDTTGTKHETRRYSSYSNYSKSTALSSYGGYSGVYGNYDAYEDEDFDALNEPKGQKAWPKESPLDRLAEAQADEEYNDAVDFACELFEVAHVAGFNLDTVSWDFAEDYFFYAGSQLAWGLVEAVQLGGYTEAELLAELLLPQTDTDDAEEVLDNLMSSLDAQQQEQHAA